MTHATSKGGKTLFVPTPYAVKMALIDACFRSAESDAEQQARRIFDFVKWSEVRVLPPEHCVVHNTFIKVLDYDREGDEGPFKSTIAYREFAFFRGEMHVAIGVNGLAPHGQQEISDLFWRVNTFGKRGSFWQCVQVTVVDHPLPAGYTDERTRLLEESIPFYASTHALDDFGDALCTAKDAFDRISTYGRGSITLGQHRVLRLSAIPYTRVSADRRSTYYRRTV